MRMQDPTITLLSCLALIATACGEDPPPTCPEDTGSPTVCAPGFLNDGGSCVPEACGVGTWGNLEVDASTVFVDAAAADGGDGSSQASLGSIQAALDQAAAQGGGLVAVAAGTYTETLELTRDHPGVYLAGRCRELVILDGSQGDSTTSTLDISIRYAQTEVSGLSIVDSAYAGIAVSQGNVLLERLNVERSAFVGIAATNNSSVAATSVEVVDCVLDGNSLMGILAYDPTTTVSLVDTVIRGTQPDSSGAYGYGIQAHLESTITATRCEISGNTGIGVELNQEGTGITLVDSVIRDTLPNASDEYGYGVQVHDGADITLEGCLLHGNTATGLLALDQGTELTLRDTTIRASLLGTSNRDEQLDVIEERALGVEVQLGASLDAQGCVLAHNRVAALVVGKEGTRASVRSSVIRNTAPHTGGYGGYGIEVNGGAELQLEDCQLSHNTTVGIHAGEPGTRVFIRDSAIGHTAQTFGPQGTAATGIAVRDQGVIIAEDLLIQGNEGPGLYGSSSGSLTCTGCTLLDNRFAGAVVLDGASLELGSTTITDSLESADLGGGGGVFAAQQDDLAEPTLRVHDCTISDSVVAGAYLSGAGSYRLTGTTITGSSGVPHGDTVRCGDGVYATGVAPWDGTTGLQLMGNTLTGNAGAGLFLDDALADLDANTWSSNETDLLLQGDVCQEHLDDWAQVPDREICPEWYQPTCDLSFSPNLDIAVIDAGLAPPPEFPSVAPNPAPARLPGVMVHPRAATR